MSNTKRAFTLLETLCVLATLCLLAAILLPVFQRARENGRRVACNSNLRQIGMAMRQYTADYDGVLVSATFADGSNWRQAVQPYVKSEALFNCPSEADRRGFVHYTKMSPHGSYLCNGAYSVRVEGDASGYGSVFGVCRPSIIRGEPVPALRESIIVDAAGTILVVCGFSGPRRPYVDFGATTTAPRVAQLQDGTFYLRTNGQDGNGVHSRHLGMGNVLYADGHAKTRSLEQLNERAARDGRIARHWTTADD